MRSISLNPSQSLPRDHRDQPPSYPSIDPSIVLSRRTLQNRGYPKHRNTETPKHRNQTVVRISCLLLLPRTHLLLSIHPSIHPSIGSNLSRAPPLLSLLSSSYLLSSHLCSYVYTASLNGYQCSEGELGAQQRLGNVSAVWHSVLAIHTQSTLLLMLLRSYARAIVSHSRNHLTEYDARHT